jgi:two-component system response regulator HydG
MGWSTPWRGGWGDKLAFRFPGVLGAAPAMREVLRLLKLVAPGDTTVLLLGETGTGKELAARAIHENSPRRDGPLVVVNCAALPETLLESELFGHEKGAFTGAAGKKEGRFLLAHQGTIFLDEIGELSLPTQAKILRVLQAREFEPLGSNRTLKVDVRVVAATNLNLEKAVKAGRFRDDLFYRLNVFPLTLPPLRERVEDLQALAAHFLKRYGEKSGKEVKALAPEVMEAFRRYPWPGNIRELENVLERGVILCQSETLTLQDLPPALQRYACRWTDAETTAPAWPDWERELISRTLEKVAGDRRQAGDILGISQEELDVKIRTHGLDY